MHKGVILLVKADSREDATEKVDDFMVPYGDGDVWDWWRIGGRWMNQLAPKDKLAEYSKQMRELLGVKEDQYGISCQALETNRDKLQKIWEDLGLKGKQPDYYDGGFSFSMPDSGEYYDVVPLTECIDTVKDWNFDADEKAEETFKKVLEERGKSKKDTMSAYYAERYASLKYQVFSFDCNVYNIDNYDYSIPEELSGWYAVMIDMHN